LITGDAVNSYFLPYFIRCVETVFERARDMEIQKVYVRQDDTGVVVCPECGISKTASVARFKDRRDPLKIRCKCGCAFSIYFEFRRAHRKETNLRGRYSRLPACMDWHSMQVRNLSQTGIGFSTSDAHGLKKGAELRVKFELDDVKRSEIEKDVIVRVVKDTYVGCEFKTSALFDKALGFYLMP
jgi:hypothetical protein